MAVGGVPILMYHRIDRPKPKSVVPGHYVPPPLFAAQMRLLARLGYETISLNALGSQEPLPPKPIAITFDDGYRNFFTHALPVLERHGMTSTVFIVTELIGKTNEWDRVKGDVEERLMDVEEIRLAQKSRTEFGSHTLDHADLKALSSEEAWRQIAESKAKLAQVVADEVTSFCYPYGRKTPQVQQLVREAGYRWACSTEKGVNTAATDPYALRRINIRKDTLMPVFLYKLLRSSRLGR